MDTFDPSDLDNIASHTPAGKHRRYSLGDAQVVEHPMHAAPSAYALMHAAIAARSRAISAAIVDPARRIARAVTVAFAAWRARRLAHATSRELDALDAHMLRDIGLDRSELTSVGAEVAGLIERDRVHALRSPHGQALEQARRGPADTDPLMHWSI